MPTINKQTRKPKSNEKRLTDRRKARQSVYNTPRWRKLRHAYLTLHPLCERCQKELATEVHHKKPFLKADGTVDNQLAYDVTNLQGLCRECHHEIHKERDSKKEDDMTRFQKELESEKDRQDKIKKLLGDISE